MDTHFAHLPVTQPAVMHADDFAHSLRLSATSRMSQEAADEFGSFIESDVKEHEAIAGVAQSRMVEVVVAGEKGRSPQGVQERNNLIAILHPQAPDFAADGRRLWRASGLRPNRYDALTISFNSAFFSPGSYLLVLEGLTPVGQSAAIGNYPFRIVKKIPEFPEITGPVLALST